MGENRLIVDNLWTYGGQALAICIAAMTGSALGGWLIWHFVIGKEKEGKA